MMLPEELLQEVEDAKLNRVSNLYLNYRHLSDIPRCILELDFLQRLFLKRNILQSLVGSPFVQLINFLKTNMSSYTLTINCSISDFNFASNWLLSALNSIYQPHLFYPYVIMDLPSFSIAKWASLRMDIHFPQGRP